MQKLKPVLEQTARALELFMRAFKAQTLIQARIAKQQDIYRATNKLNAPLDEKNDGEKMDKL